MSDHDDNDGMKNWDGEDDRLLMLMLIKLEHFMHGGKIKTLNVIFRISKVNSATAATAATAAAAADGLMMTTMMMMVVGVVMVVLCCSSQHSTRVGCGADCADVITGALRHCRHRVLLVQETVSARSARGLALKELAFSVPCESRFGLAVRW